MESSPEQSDDGLVFDPASFGSRLGARAIDGAIGIVTYLTVFFIVVATSDIDLTNVDDEIIIPDSAQWIIRWVPFLIWGLYEVLLVINRGQTVGKMVTRIKVVTTSGDDPPGPSPAVIRWAVLVLPMVLIPDLVGVFISFLVGMWFVWDKNRQGLHDKAASTQVVKATPSERTR